MQSTMMEKQENIFYFFCFCETDLFPHEIRDHCEWTVESSLQHHIQLLHPVNFLVYEHHFSDIDYYHTGSLSCLPAHE